MAVQVRETGTGPFRHVVVDVPAGAHPASLAAALRQLPIGCEFANMADLSGTRSGGELHFKVHEQHPSVTGGLAHRLLRLADDDPFTGSGSAFGEGDGS
ncbi:hypothetical protein [Frankia sp. EI5c]|uniref:hypothetical protein n=1 Tax=Frankia sp. EI5c TaxID=683316 RepID=UPI0008260067|nr:hypothetical protein [Frankia sp. EI5c]